MLVVPVIFPPGRARLATESVAAGSKVATNASRDLARSVPRRQHRRRLPKPRMSSATTDQLGDRGRHLRRVLRQGDLDDVVAALV